MSRPVGSASSLGRGRDQSQSEIMVVCAVPPWPMPSDRPDGIGVGRGRQLNACTAPHFLKSIGFDIDEGQWMIDGTRLLAV